MCSSKEPSIPCPECSACIDCASDDCLTCCKRLEFFDQEFNATDVAFDMSDGEAREIDRLCSQIKELTEALPYTEEYLFIKRMYDESKVRRNRSVDFYEMRALGQWIKRLESFLTYNVLKPMPVKKLTKRI